MVVVVVKIPFTMATKKVKYFGINLTRYVQKHRRKMQKTLLKDSK